MASQQLDIITTLPQPIIETILCLLPTDEAARTSILSREWRYKWTTIPKLSFHEHFVYKLTNTLYLEKNYSIAMERRNMGRRLKVVYAIYQVLLMREAPIREFTLLMDVDETCYELDRIIFNLSRNHPIRKLTLNLHSDGDPYNLPLSFFSMHQLVELNLNHCDLVRQPTFDGFRSLTSLSLVWVTMSKETFLRLLSNCSSLKRLCLELFDEHMLDDDRPTMMELFKCIPMVEHLTVKGYIGLFLVEDAMLSIQLIHLKYFCSGHLDFSDDSALPFLFELIKCSPNLEKVKLEDFGEEGELDETEPEPDVLKEYSNVRLEHLNELEIEFSYYSDLMEFVKFILVRSPNLKKVILRPLRVVKNKELKMLKGLLRAPHASSVKFIIVNASESKDGHDHGDGDDDDDDDD